jgi:hypothetical protein
LPPRGWNTSSRCRGFFGLRIVDNDDGRSARLTERGEKWRERIDLALMRERLVPPDTVDDPDGALRRIDSALIA